jgi:hypothetical protein
MLSVMCVSSKAHIVAIFVNGLCRELASKSVVMACQQKRGAASRLVDHAALTTVTATTKTAAAATTT